MYNPGWPSVESGWPSLIQSWPSVESGLAKSRIWDGQMYNPGWPSVESGLPGTDSGLRQYTVESRLASIEPVFALYGIVWAIIE
jgi:hypothetical protein